MVSTKGKYNMKEQNARERILKAALKVFAEKSFEGSRMDEIAREASAPKSLIYYHFKSKDEILEVLTTNFLEEYEGLLGEHVKETHQEKAEELSDRMKHVYYGFGQQNADLVRVMLVEALKKSSNQTALFQMIDCVMKKEAEEKNLTERELQERRIAEFFSNFMPNFAYVCFGESWTNYFNMERKQFDELYLKVYEETHGAYHKNHK